MVQRTSAGEISQYKRASQGVRVMNIKDDDCVSAVAPVMEGSSEDKVVEEAAAAAADAPPAVDQPELATDAPAEPETSDEGDAAEG
jgi:DNA gyrase subunit A